MPVPESPSAPICHKRMKRPQVTNRELKYACMTRIVLSTADSLGCGDVGTGPSWLMLAAPWRNPMRTSLANTFLAVAPALLGHGGEHGAEYSDSTCRGGFPYPWQPT